MRNEGEAMRLSTTWPEAWQAEEVFEDGELAALKLAFYKDVKVVRHGLRSLGRSMVFRSTGSLGPGG